MRAFHRWPGILAALLLLVLSLSGAALSLFPVAEHLSLPRAADTLSVADLTASIQLVHPDVEQIRRAPSGKITAYWFESGAPQAAVIDPATGRDILSADPNPLERWLTGLHRSFFLGDAGRMVTAAGAAAMLVLALSGAVLVARRAGGWRRWFARLRGPLAGRLHVEIARVAVAGLLLSSATALWMTASTFDLLPDGSTSQALLDDASGQTGMAPAKIDLLRQSPLFELRSLSFPDPGDRMDVFTLKTDRGTGYLDQGTGALLAWSELTRWLRISETVYMLHTGQGAASLALVLGGMALGVPALAGTGIAVWLAGRRGRPEIRANVPAGRAGTIVLVGSEGGSTWGFAATLHAALAQAGQTVHTSPLSSFDPARYGQARRILILAATYGDGDAPASAGQFLTRLKSLPAAPGVPLAVLGFGDRSFPAYCAFARAVAATAQAEGWGSLLPFDTVDRQSAQDFTRWGRSLGAAIGIDLELVHQAARPATLPLMLVSRRDHGAEVQAPTAILRFALPKASLRQRLAGRALLFAGIGPSRRLRRNRREEASGGPVFQPAFRSAAGRYRHRLPPPQSEFPRQPQPCAADPDRRGNGDRPAGGLRACQCAPPSHPPVLRYASPRQRLSVWRGAGGLAAGRSSPEACHGLFARAEVPLCAGCPARGGRRGGAPDPAGRAGHGLRRAWHGGRGFRRACRHPRSHGDDDGPAESGGTLCRGYLLTCVAAP